MTPAALLQRLNRRGMFRIKPGLDRIQTVLSALGNPQDAIPAIHIAGTNGKGSVAAYLESVLRQAGFRTGLYTSPHLRDIRERIQINRQLISTAVFANTADVLFDAERRMRVTLTYFEFLTAMAFIAFKDAAVDLIILEAGMGGRWDATNVIRRPALTLITSIGLDHTQWLGRTETAIAREKAGILKPGVPVICGARGPAANVIAARARDIDAPIQLIDKDFRAVSDAAEWHDTFQRMAYTAPNGMERLLALRLLGRYQIDNAAVALAGLDSLIQSGWKIGTAAIEQGLSDVTWPGRFQNITSHNGAALLFDGAHNPPALRQLIDSLANSPWKNTPKTILFSAYRDKDYKTMLRILRPHAEKIILCTLPGKRALPAAALARAAGRGKSDLRIIPNPHKALKTALASTPRDQVVVVTGSLTLVGLLLPEAPSFSHPLNSSLARERTAVYA